VTGAARIKERCTERTEVVSDSAFEPMLRKAGTEDLSVPERSITNSRLRRPPSRPSHPAMWRRKGYAEWKSTFVNVSCTNADRTARPRARVFERLERRLSRVDVCSDRDETPTALMPADEWSPDDGLCNKDVLGCLGSPFQAVKLLRESAAASTAVAGRVAQVARR